MTAERASRHGAAAPGDAGTEPPGPVRVATSGPVESQLSEIWPDVPSAGRVALVVDVLDAQGRGAPHGLEPVWVEAAAARLSSRGAQVTVVAAPGRLEVDAPCKRMVDRWREAGLSVTTESAAVTVVVGGETLATAPVLQAVADADHLAVLGPAMRHRHLGVAASRWSLRGGLSPNAREQLMRACARPEQLDAALDELAHRLSPRWLALVVGHARGVVFGADDVATAQRAAEAAVGIERGDAAHPPLPADLVALGRSAPQARLPPGADDDGDARLGWYPTVDPALCTACSACVTVCPTEAVTLPSDADPVVYEHADCVRCGICVDACQEVALTNGLRPMAVKRRERVLGLSLEDAPIAHGRDAAVPIEAALGLGAAAFDAPPKRPSWLEGVAAPERALVVESAPLLGVSPPVADVEWPGGPLDADAVWAWRRQGKTVVGVRLDGSSEAFEAVQAVVRGGLSAVLRVAVPDLSGDAGEAATDALAEGLRALFGGAGDLHLAWEGPAVREEDAAGDDQKARDRAAVLNARGARLAWAAFEARRPGKIPILNEELPFCNDNCLHCGVAEIMKTANVVPFHAIAKSLDALAEPSGGQVMYAVSELTIRPDFLRIVKASRRAGMGLVAVVTNARMFMYPEFTRRAVEGGLTHALVSVYGPTPRTHQAITRTPKSFEQTIAGLRELAKYPQVTLMTNSVITKKNYRYLPQLVEFLAGLGVRNVNLSFVQIVGAAERYQRALVPRIRDVLPHLEDALVLGRALGLRMGVGGLPFCVLKGFEDCFGVDDLTYIENADQSDDNITHRSPYTSAAACDRCAMSAVCLGMQDTYLRQYGEEELSPYPGPKRVRRPASPLVRAMFPHMQWTAAGAPSSLFDDVSGPPPSGFEGPEVALRIRRRA